MIATATDSLLSGPPLTGAVETLAGHVDRLGPLPAAGPGLIDRLEAAGLRGRGGAAFPAARKWRALLHHATLRGVPPMIVANGSEGEPCSLKDRLLLRSRPHLVLDGLLLAARSLGARETVLYLPGDEPELRDIVEGAIRERRDERPRPRLVLAPPRYVAGEESAAIARIEGGAAKPRVTPPLPVAAGVHGRPTLVQNVETLARAALIARGGDGAAGRLLVTLCGAVTQPGIAELVTGATVADAVATAGGCPGGASAVLVGGYFGRWLGASELHLRLGVDVPAGTGVIAVLDSRHCGLVETASILGYLGAESAGQCGPCVNGVPALAEGMAALAGTPGRSGRVDRLLRWSQELRGRGACHHPDGAAALTESALRVFADDVQTHLRHGRCPRSAAGPLLPVPETGGGWR